MKRVIWMVLGILGIGLVSYWVAWPGPTTVKVTVGGHVFRVPKANIVEERLFFFPGNNDGLIFILNPDEPGNRQMGVVLLPTRRACPGGLKHGEQEHGILCTHGSMLKVGQRPYTQEELLKVDVDFIGPTRRYKLIDKQHATVSTIATCRTYGGSDPSDGECGSMALYKDLIYSIDYPEDRIYELPLIAAQIHHYLSEWEVTEE